MLARLLKALHLRQAVSQHPIRQITTEIRQQVRSIYLDSIEFRLTTALYFNSTLGHKLEEGDDGCFRKFTPSPNRLTSHLEKIRLFYHKYQTFPSGSKVIFKLFELGRQLYIWLYLTLANCLALQLSSGRVEGKCHSQTFQLINPASCFLSCFCDYCP